MFYFNHPKPPCRKAVAVQVVQQRAGLVPDTTTIIVEAKRDKVSLERKKSAPEGR